MMTKAKKAEQEEAIAYLRAVLRPGDTVYTKSEHVSRSGMMHHISLYVIRENEPINITYRAAAALDYCLADRGLKVGGYGMDMGFAVVYNLSRTLFPDGFGIPMVREKRDIGPSRKETPKSHEHANKLYALGYRAYGRNGDSSGWDSDGGYALHQRWL